MKAHDSNKVVSTAPTHKATPATGVGGKVSSDTTTATVLRTLIPLRIICVKNDVDSSGNYPVVLSILIFGIKVFEYRQIEPW